MDQQAPTSPPQQSGLAVASLICGILGLVGTGPITGIVAIITGHMAKKQIRQNPQMTGSGMATAGLIMGWLATIIGIIAVIVVVVMIMGAATAFSSGMAGAARETATEAKIRELSAQLEMYRLVAGAYPTEEQGLNALVEKPTTAPVPAEWRQFMVTVPLDPWDNEYSYRNPGSIDSSTYEIISPGPDGRMGTLDDISSQDSP